MDKLQDLRASIFGVEKTGLIDFSQSSLWSAKDLLSNALTLLTTLQYPLPRSLSIPSSGSKYNHCSFHSGD
jgi:hypothetical protein